MDTEILNTLSHITSEEQKLRYYLAVDIGASSGRHILGHLEEGRMVLEEVYRFDNRQVRKNGHDCWDMDNR